MNESRFVQWRKANPVAYDELLRRRREKYADNPDAREKQLKQNAAWRAKQKKRKTRKKRTPRPRQFRIGERVIECWSIGRTAEFLGVSKQTITNLESLGTIPTNHHVCASRRRWWPATYVQWLKPFFEARFTTDGTGISAQEFHRRVWTAWGEEQVRGEIPVIDASQVNGDGDEDSAEGGGP